MFNRRTYHVGAKLEINKRRLPKGLWARECFRYDGCEAKRQAWDKRRVVADSK